MNMSRITELNEQLASVIEFQELPRRNVHRQSPEDNALRGLIVGGMAQGLPGALGSYGAGLKFEDEGVVYKKRDALGHSIGGYLLGGVPVGVMGRRIGYEVGNVMGLPSRGKLRAAKIAGIAGTVGGSIAMHNLLAKRTLRKRLEEQEGRTLLSAGTGRGEIIEFRGNPYEDEERGINWGGIAAAGAGVAGLGAGGYYLHKAINNRVGGLRITQPGFADQTAFRQYMAGARSLGEDAWNSMASRAAQAKEAVSSRTAQAKEAFAEQAAKARGMFNSSAERVRGLVRRAQAYGRGVADDFQAARGDFSRMAPQAGRWKAGLRIAKRFGRQVLTRKFSRRGRLIELNEQLRQVLTMEG